jgi:hypothetical protein
MRALAVAVLLVAGSAVAAPSQEEQARDHFAAGQREYQAGHWADALHQFELGYALSPRPEFLINFAQALRKLGDYDRAIVECERYLATAPPSPMAAEAHRLLARIREERAQKVTAPPPPPPPVEAKPVEPAPPPPAPVEVKPPPAVVIQPAGDKPPPDRHRRKVIGWAIGGTAIGLAVAAGVTLAVVFGTPVKNTYPNAPGGAVDFR